MKIYDKEKFYYLNTDGSRKEPKEGDIYFNHETEFSTTFPFIFRLYNNYNTYKLTNGLWVQE